MSTAIILFAKGGKTENVFFYDVQSDGFTMDDKRTQIGDGKGDLPSALAKYREWCEGTGDFSDRTAQDFEVSAEEISAQGFDLSINRYKELLVKPRDHVRPEDILDSLRTLEVQIMNDISELTELLK